MSVANDKWDSDTVPLWRTGPRRRAFMVRDAVQFHSNFLSFHGNLWAWNSVGTIADIVIGGP
jgi:hypothetical protein